MEFNERGGKAIKRHRERQYTADSLHNDANNWTIELILFHIHILHRWLKSTDYLLSSCVWAPRPWPPPLWLCPVRHTWRSLTPGARENPWRSCGGRTTRWTTPPSWACTAWAVTQAPQENTVQHRQSAGIIIRLAYQTIFRDYRPIGIYD